MMIREMVSTDGAAFTHTRMLGRVYCRKCRILIKFFVTSTNILSYVNSESKLGIEILESKHLIRNQFEISKESVMNIPILQ